MAPNFSRMKGSLSMSLPLRVRFGGLSLWMVLLAGCGPSAVCTSDSECEQRFGPYSACILSGERGLCYVDDTATHKGKRDDGEPVSNDAGSEDGGALSNAVDAGVAIADAGSSSQDAGLSGENDGGTTASSDAGEAEEMPTPPQIDSWRSEQTEFFVAEGVLLFWQVLGADHCEIHADDDSVLPLSMEEIEAGQIRVFPTTTISYTLRCSRTRGEDTANSQSEAIQVSPYADVEITSLRANDADGPLSVNEYTTVRFSWSSTNATDCHWSWQDSDEIPPENVVEDESLQAGEISFEIRTSGSFRFRCAGNGPEANASLVVRVAYISSFAADDDLIAQGTETTLRWTVVNSDTGCELLSGDAWVPVEGNETSVSPEVTTIFQLRCAGEGGTPLEKTLEVQVLRIESFQSTAESVRYDESTLISWQTHEAASCTLWQNDVLVFETTAANVGEGQYTTDSLRDDATFVLKCQRRDVEVVSEDIGVVIEVTITDFSAYIDEDVTDSIRLVWKAEATRDVQRCTLDGFMYYLSNQQELTLANPGVGPMTTYTLTCFGSQGARVSDQAKVNIVWGNGSDVAEEDWDAVAVIMGSLFLASDAWDGVSTFQSLRDVGGNVVMESSDFATLSMPRLEKVYGKLSIGNSDALETISLPRLREVGGQFDIHSNSQLTHVNAPLLTKVGSDFRLSHSGASLDLQTTSLAEVGREFEISHTQLSDLTGLSALRKVAGDYLRILSNARLSCAQIDTFYCALENGKPWPLVNNNAVSMCTLSCSP